MRHLAPGLQIIFLNLFLGNLKLNQIYLFNKILPKLNAGADSLNITQELSI